MKFKESEVLEFKKSTSELKEVIISVAAILNKHQKGELYFGIKNDGSVVGQDVTDKTLRDISQAFHEHLEPKIYPKIELTHIENKNVIYISFSGEELPYLAYGRGYIRVADEDKRLSARELEKLILKKNIDKLSWDDKVSDKSVDDINEEVLKKFIEKAKSVGRVNFDYENKKITLEKLKLLKGNKLLRAAEILFCDDNSLELQTAIFAGKDKLTFLDIKQFEGNLFYLLQQAELYISDSMKWRVEFGHGLERKEIPEVPIAAIREAIVNSFCHRNYNRPESNKIALYKDRIEIYNIGGFPEGEPEDFITGDKGSVLRNKLISKMLYYTKDIERWGSGLKRIVNECEYNNINYDFRNKETEFTAVFYRIPIGVGTTRITTRITTQIVLDVLRENPGITRQELADKLGIKKDGVKYHLKRLTEDGYIKRIGTKGGKWEIL